MNKTKIKNFSIWARRNLIEVVAYRMRFLGIDENGIAPEMEGSTDKLKLYDMGTSKPAEVADKDIAKRVRLASHIREHEKTSDYKTAYETVVEEIAYTWFNRLIAIRFMEVNDYLPSGVRVLSSESGKREPDIVTNAVEVAEAEGFSISKDDIWKLKDENKLDELFRILFIQQCKKLHEVLPELFDNSQDDYTEMLLPISFIDDDAFIRHLVTDIDEADFNLSEQGQVEIIGWLYQYYNSEKKDAVFAAMSNKVKVSKENIAAATQLFTPDWIVRYMVENSLGRLWVDGHADTSARSEWKYYLNEAQQSPEVQAQLAEIREGRKQLSPEQIRFIDPCMGSGHILVYAFDVLMQIYLSCGYTERDAAQNIVRHNLWGLDLDKRAYQLAYFAVMMKARQYDRRFLTRNIKPNLSHFQDLPTPNYSLLDEPIKSFVEQFDNADTYGSLITVQADDSIDEALDNYVPTLDLSFSHMEHLMNLYKILSQRYDVVCTNPPYMTSKSMGATLLDFIQNKYPDAKYDLFSCFMKKCIEFTIKNGYFAMITMQGWMYLTSFVEIRAEMLQYDFLSLARIGYNSFPELNSQIAHACTFVCRKTSLKQHKGKYFELNTGKVTDDKEQVFIDRINNNHYYVRTNDDFRMIPDAPLAFVFSDNLISAFANKKMSDIASPRQGLATADNNRFLRQWFEIEFDRCLLDASDDEVALQSKKKWFPYNKGGEFRKWYGNNDYLVNWENNGFELRNFKNSVLRNQTYYFKECFTWSKIATDTLAFRYKPCGHLFDVAGTSVFATNDMLYYLLGLCNSCVAMKILKTLSPTVNFEVGHIASLPIILSKDKKDDVEFLVNENIGISKEDWDSFETSWDFKEHPFVKWSKSLWDATSIACTMQAYYGEKPKVSCPLELCFLLWQGECNERRKKLKANEEELNRIFIEIYGLQDELTPEVDDKDITVRPADLQRDMRSFVSYAVGCMFGRYSLDREGLVFAGGEWDERNYTRFPADPDNCLPITEEHFFEDDIVTQFANFVQAVFGEDSLEDNLRYVAENLGIKGNGTAREKIRQYFLKEFFKDHCKVYQKRPIYWLFDTGKKNGFKALCYVHRWTVNTVGDVRIDYMHKLQRLYRNEIIRLKENIDAGEEIAKSQKRLEKITNQLQETEEYDAKIGIVVAARTEIDLDDGVKVNYDKVQVGSDGKHYQILAKI